MHPNDVRRDRAELDGDASAAIVLRADLEAVGTPAHRGDALDPARVTRLKVGRRPSRLGSLGYQPRAIHSSRCGRSRPMVVGLPCPGRTSISSGRVKSLLLMLSMIVGKLA
jgi:hypothetical protein